jgi:hypothetical protein
VGGVPVTVVHVVGVILVRDGDVAAVGRVLVLVAPVLGVVGGLALVRVIFVHAVQVAVVGVVGVIAVRDFGVAAAGAVDMLVFGVLVMRCGHRTSSFPITGYVAPSVTTH